MSSKADEVDELELSGDPEKQAEARAQVKLKVETDIAKAKALIASRKGAYYRVFVEGTPTPDDRLIVLRDLKSFCRFGRSTYDVEERTHCLLTGRQEVMLRVDDYMRLDVDELFNLYVKPQE